MEIFGDLWKFSENVWKHFRLYFRNSLVIFGNFQKMFGSSSRLESLGRFWRILGNPQKVVRNLHKIINNVVIRLCPYYNKLYMAADSYMYVSSVHFYIISECTAVLSCTCTSIILTYSMFNIKYVLYLQWYPTCTLYCTCISGHVQCAM